MATQKQANLAREQNSNLLKELGAHAISVDQVTKKGKKTFAVIAHVEEISGHDLQNLEVKTGEKTIKVPLEIRKSEKFSLE